MLCIIQKDAQTLRCYFASEQPGQRQAQAWFRDFDLASETFTNRIHKAQLKTAAGVFEMQPQHFHAYAAGAGISEACGRISACISSTRSSSSTARPTWQWQQFPRQADEAGGGA